MRGEYSNRPSTPRDSGPEAWHGAPGIPSLPLSAPPRPLRFADLLAQAEAVQDRVVISKAALSGRGQGGFLWQMLQAGRFRIRQATGGKGARAAGQGRKPGA